LDEVLERTDQQVPALPHVRREREAVMAIEVAVLPLMP